MVDYEQYRPDNSRSPDPASENSGKRPNSRAWMGCCAGCVGVVLVLILAFGIGLYLLLRSRPVMPPEAFLLPDADGFVALRIEPEDEGLTAFLESLAADPPPALDIPEKHKERLRENAANTHLLMEKWTPINCVFLMYLRDESEKTGPRDFELPKNADIFPTPLGDWADMPGVRNKMQRFSLGFAGSTSRAGGLMRWFVRAATAEIVEQSGREEEYRDVKIGIMPDDFLLGAVDNNFLLADRSQIIYSWIDVLKETEAGKDFAYNGPPHLEKIYRRIEPPAPIYFAVSNRQNEVPILVESFLEEQAESSSDNNYNNKMVISLVKILAEHVEAIGGYLRVISPNETELNIYAECKNAEHAREAGANLAELLKWGKREAAIEGYVKVEIDGNTAHVRLKVENLTELLHGHP